MSRYTKRSRWLAAGAASLVAAGACAGQITLFEQRDFQGRFLTTDDAVANLERSGFNDIASSIVITDGIWQACSDAYYRGRCVELRPGSYSNLTTELNDRISSVRQVGYQGAMLPPPSVAAVPGPTRIVLFDHSRRGTRSVDLTTSVRDLSDVQFNKRADAAYVYGGVWRLCDLQEGRGECTELAPGRYDNLGALTNRISSVELVATSTPQRIGTPDRVTAVPLAVPPQFIGRIVLYEHPSFGGRWVTIDRGRAPDLDWAHFYDRAGSLRVESGSWMVCTEMGYQGDCRILGPGEYPQLLGALQGGISSARQVWRPEYGALNAR